MLTENEIRVKWNEICRKDRPKGCIVDSGAYAIELVRWVESGLTQRAADAPESDEFYEPTCNCEYCRGVRAKLARR